MWERMGAWHPCQEGLVLLRSQPANLLEDSLKNVNADSDKVFGD